MTTDIKRSTILFRVSTAAVMLTATLTTGSAFAGPSVEQAPSEVVKFEELNLNTTAGVATLYARIHSAALRVCSSGTRDLARLQREQSCVKQAEANAVKGVHDGALTAYFEKKTGRPLAAFAPNDQVIG